MIKEAIKMYIIMYIGVILIGIAICAYSFQTKKDKIIQIITSMLSATIFILTGLNMFTEDLNLYTGDYTYTSNCGWFGTILIILGVIMTLYTVLLIYQIFAQERFDISYRGHG